MNLVAFVVVDLALKLILLAVFQMIILKVLPISILTDNSVEIDIIKGGTDVHFSPTINYIKNALLPVLRKFNVNASVKILKYGYYPKGMGVTLKVFLSKRIRSVVWDKGET